MKITVGEEYDGLTVKKVLFDRLGYSRKAVTALKTRERGITVNGERRTVRCVLKKGDELTLDLADAEPSPRVRPSAGELEILYEDAAFLCVNKPPYMAVHPSKKLQDDTLAGRILFHYSPMVFRAAGRLDRNTSGAVLCAKNKVISDRFTRLILSHRIRKEYLAICRGAGKLPEDGVIRLGIRRSAESYVTRECFEATPDTPESERAETRCRVLLRSGGRALILASPVTGRTHQIRAHLSAVGLPIEGDTLYGEESPIIGRQALHALRLTFPHPETGEEIRIAAPLHPDYEKALEAAFGEAGLQAARDLFAP